MDGIGWVWMTTSQLGRCSQLGLLGLGFAAGLAGLGFSSQNICITVNTIHLHTYHPFLWLKGHGNGWMGADDLCAYLIIIPPHKPAVSSKNKILLMYINIPH